jgi:signal transduction histidine kinase
MPDDVPLAQQPRRLTVGSCPVEAAEPGGQDASAPAGQDACAPVGQAAAGPGPLTPSVPLPAITPWLTGLARWDRFYAAVFAAVVVLTAATASGSARVIALTALAAMVPWYLLVGRPAMARPDTGSDRRGYLYLAGLIMLFALADSQDPSVWFLAFALCPQCFHVLRARAAIWPAILLNLIGAGSIAYYEPNRSGYSQAVAVAAFAIVFCQAYSGFVLGVIEQWMAQAELNWQLEQTRAELALVSREAGVLAERQRLAGEIHDTLAQGFSSILMLIQAADAQLEPAPSTARNQLELAAQTARENLAEARMLVGGLASAQLGPGALEDALRRIAERAADELGVRATFETTGPGRQLAAGTEVVLLRTGQEAIANVRKHAAARSVAIRLSYAELAVRLEVSDDGVGFDPEVVNGGYGLRGMRMRVDEAGGQVHVTSRPGSGTSVQVEVPG